MARYCVAFESMKRLLALRGSEELGELVGVLAQCKEFEDVRLRVSEKRVLNSLNKDKHRATIRCVLVYVVHVLDAIIILFVGFHLMGKSSQQT